MLPADGGPARDGANLNVDNPFQPKASVQTEANLGGTYTFTYDLTISTDLPARP